MKANYYLFSVTSVWITFLSNGRVSQEGGGGVDPGQLKKFRQGGHLGGLTNISFTGIFLFNAVASLDYISLVGIVRPGVGGGGGVGQG